MQGWKRIFPALVAVLIIIGAHEGYLITSKANYEQTQMKYEKELEGRDPVRAEVNAWLRNHYSELSERFSHGAVPSSTTTITTPPGIDACLKVSRHVRYGCKDFSMMITFIMS